MNVEGSAYVVAAFGCREGGLGLCRSNPNERAIVDGNAQPNSREPRNLRSLIEAALGTATGV